MPAESISFSFFDVVEKMSQVCPDLPETLDPALAPHNASPLVDDTPIFFMFAATAAHHWAISKACVQRGLGPMQLPGPDHHLHPGNCLA